MRRAPPTLLAVFIAAVLSPGCESPNSPDPADAATVELAAPSAARSTGGPVSPGRQLSPEELLSDPLLHLMLRDLSDPGGAGAISAAIDTTRSRLASGDSSAARASLDAAYAAFHDYGSVADLSDEDVVYLDAVERFLDEVEAMIDAGTARGRKDKRTKR
jgi:MoxR-like ATPase